MNVYTQTGDVTHSRQLHIQFNTEFIGTADIVYDVTCTHTARVTARTEQEPSQVHSSQSWQIWEQLKPYWNQMEQFSDLSDQSSVPFVPFEAGLVEFGSKSVCLQVHNLSHKIH